MRLAIIYLCLAAGCASAAQVIRVGSSHELVEISHDPGSYWKLDERACVTPPEPAPRRCGTVILTSAHAALLLFPSPQTEPREGDGVVADPESRPGSRLAGAREATQLRDEAEKRHFDEMVYFYQEVMRTGTATPAPELTETSSHTDAPLPSTLYDVMAGINLYYPTLTFELATQEHWAVGLTASYYAIDLQGQKSQTYGGLLGVNYYGKEPFHGLWGQLAAGYFTAHTDLLGVATTQTAYSALATVGWRIRHNAFNLGLAAGGQAYYLPKNESLQFSTLVLLPAVLVDIGWVF